MGYEIDAGVVEVGMQLVTAGMPIAAPAVRDDWETLRSNSDGALAVIESMLPQHPLVERSDLTGPSWDDEPVGVRLYRPPDASGVGAPLVLYFHGGGMMSGSVALMISQ